METIAIAFYVSMFLWLFSEIYYAIKLRSGNKDQKGKDGSSFLILWVVISASIFIAISASGIFKTPIANGDWLSWIGILMILTGLIVRFFIIQNLGKYFTVDVTIRKDHKVKTDGFYTYIRHPSYAFSLLMFLGLGLALNNWVSLAIAFIPPFIAFSYRIFVEEKALVEQFKDEYTQYRKTSKKLIPFIY